jgi:hypothetical protein
VLRSGREGHGATIGQNATAHSCTSYKRTAPRGKSARLARAACGCLHSDMLVATPLGSRGSGYTERRAQSIDQLLERMAMAKLQKKCGDQGTGYVRSIVTDPAINGTHTPGCVAQCVGGDAVCCAPFYMPFWWLEEPHKATRSFGRVMHTPQHPRLVNGIQRTKANRPVSTIYDFFFSLPSWPRTALDRVPRHPATPRQGGGF